MNVRQLQNDIARLDKKASNYRSIPTFSLNAANKKARLWRIVIFASSSIILIASTAMALQKAEKAEVSKSYAQDTNGQITPIATIARVRRSQNL